MLGCCFILSLLFSSLSDISFQLAFHDDVDRNETCDSLDFFDKGVELAIRRSEDEQWVPLKFYTLSGLSSLTGDRGVRIDIGTYDQANSILSLRDYNVSVVAGDTSVMNVTECNRAVAGERLPLDPSAPFPPPLSGRCHLVSFSFLYRFVLYCIVLYCVLYCIVLCCIVLYFNAKKNRSVNIKCAQKWNWLCNPGIARQSMDS